MSRIVSRAVLAAAVSGVLYASAALAAADAPAGDAAKDPVVATVNGEALHRSDLEKTKAMLAQQMPQIGMMPMEALYQGLLDRAITGRLLTAEARKAGLQDSPEVKAQMAQIEAELIQRAYLAKAVDAKITDAALKDAYKKLIDATPAEEEVHARHILVDDEAKAKDLLKKIKGGADFAEIAKAETTDPSGKTSGGDLGFFTKGDMVPEFAEAAFAMKVGAISEQPVKTQFGWHIIKVEERRKKTPPTFDEAKEELRGQLAEQAIESIITDIKGKAKVETFNIDGSKADPAKADEPKK